MFCGVMSIRWSGNLDFKMVDHVIIICYKHMDWGSRTNFAEYWVLGEGIVQLNFWVSIDSFSTLGGYCTSDTRKFEGLKSILPQINWYLLYIGILVAFWQDFRFYGIVTISFSCRDVSSFRNLGLEQKLEYWRGNTIFSELILNLLSF